MRHVLCVVSSMGATVVLIAIGAMTYVRTSGLESRSTPSSFEVWMARTTRRLAIPGRVRALRNPVAASPEVLSEGLAHFADHCASCHANDGSGNTEIGRGFYPKTPDMRLPATQGLSDGELFYVIENGIRFT